MSDRRGFTIVEVLVAVLVLSIGILGLVGTAALVTRMIGQGERYSRVSTLAMQRVEVLRSRKCSGMANGSQTQGMYQVSWKVDSIGLPPGRRITVTVKSPDRRTGGTRTDMFQTTMVCSP